MTPSTWRASRHVLAGGPVALGAAAALGALFAVWFSALYSLIERPTGAWYLPVTYGLAVLLVPAIWPWLVGELAALQRYRFRVALGVELTAPSGPPLLKAWASAVLWRQLGYHGLALVAGPAAAALAALSWTSPLLLLRYGLGAPADRWPALVAVLPAAGLVPLAPRLARGLARLDLLAGRRLLGPSRTDELTRRVEDLARSRSELIAAADAERRRIERDLHDGAQQRLVSLAMNLGMARAALTDLPDAAREVIEAAHDEATQALAELRELVRGLHPAVLDNRGLDAALSGVVARAPLPVKLTVAVAQRCAPSIEAIAYFTVSEALTNVAKHAQARRAAVTVERTGDTLRIVVTDDGRGGATTVDGAGSGLRGLAQRAAAVDGTLSVHSPPGGPTTLTVELPCQ